MPSSTSGPDRSILLVEDEPALQRVLIRLLEKLGRPVTAVSSATEAKVALDDLAGPVLLVADHFLGEESGVDLAVAAIEARPDVEVVMMSGSGPEIPLERIPADHLRGVLMKPFRLEELQALLD